MGFLERVFHATEEENRRTILRLLPARAGGSMLDLGTHEGEFTERVAEWVQPERVLGVELLAEHAAVARSRGIDVLVGDIDNGLPFGDGAVDLVHANQVIEHVRRTDGFLSEIRRVLEPGGLALISTNNLSSWHNVLSLVLGYQPTPMHVSDEVIVGNPLDPYEGLAHEDIGRTHLRLFTERALVQLCRHHGLERVAVKHVGYYPLPPRLARLAVRLDPAHSAFLVGLFRAA
jgi:SAM-dependent methyltransferase